MTTKVCILFLIHKYFFINIRYFTPLSYFILTINPNNLFKGYFWAILDTFITKMKNTRPNT